MAHTKERIEFVASKELKRDMQKCAHRAECTLAEYLRRAHHVAKASLDSLKIADAN